MPSVCLKPYAFYAKLVHTCILISFAILTVLTDTLPMINLEFARIVRMIAKLVTATGLVSPVMPLTTEYTATILRDVFPLMATLTIFQGWL